MSNGDRDRLRKQQIALAKVLTKVDVGQPVNQQDSLAGLDVDEIARSAETLIRKRLSQTRAALRGSAQILGEDFAKEFRLFAATHFFNGSKAIWLDAIEFSRWLAARHESPPWLHDALRWERERCQWQCRRWYFSLFRMRYGIAAWLDGSGDRPPESRIQWILVWRLGRRGGVYAFPRCR